MTETIAERVKRVIVHRLPVSAHKVSERAKFFDDLGVDGLDLGDLIADLEGEFDVKFSDEEVDKWSTVQDAIDYVTLAMEAERA